MGSPRRFVLFSGVWMRWSSMESLRRFGFFCGVFGCDGRPWSGLSFLSTNPRTRMIYKAMNRTEIRRKHSTRKRKAQEETQRNHDSRLRSPPLDPKCRRAWATTQTHTEERKRTQQNTHNTSAKFRNYGSRRKSVASTNSQNIRRIKQCKNQTSHCSLWSQMR